MSRAMSANPATAFQTFAQDMSGLEEESLRKVRLDAREEREIGRKALMEYLERADQAGHEEVADEAKLQYLKALVATFAAHMRNGARYPAIEVRLIDAPVADGQCFPGGFLVFTTGLLDEPDEATVAGFVAHELAHLDRGHVYQYARRTKLAQTAFRPGPDADFNAFFTDGMAMMGIMMNPYRPDHEHEADCEAVAWHYQEGYDPRALSCFFARLAERQRERPGEGAMPFGMFRRSHPYSLDRERHTQARLGQLERWKPRDDLGLYAENLRALRPKGAGAAPPVAAAPPLPPPIVEPRRAADEDEDDGPGVIVAPRPRGSGR
jgi:predicted Zn-dependent protease